MSSPDQPFALSLPEVRMAVETLVNSGKPVGIRPVWRVLVERTGRRPSFATVTRLLRQVQAESPTQPSVADPGDLPPTVMASIAEAAPHLWRQALGAARSAAQQERSTLEARLQVQTAAHEEVVELLADAEARAEVAEAARAEAEAAAAAAEARAGGFGERIDALGAETAHLRGRVDALLSSLAQDRAAGQEQQRHSAGLAEQHASMAGELETLRTALAVAQARAVVAEEERARAIAYAERLADDLARERGARTDAERLIAGQQALALQLSALLDR